MDFKLLQEDSLSVKTYIRNVQFGHDTTFFYSTEFNKELAENYSKISYSQNALHIAFATPVFNDNKYLLHSYIHVLDLNLN